MLRRRASLPERKNQQMKREMPNQKMRRNLVEVDGRGRELGLEDGRAPATVGTTAAGAVPVTTTVGGEADTTEETAGVMTATDAMTGTAGTTGIGGTTGDGRTGAAGTADATAGMTGLQIKMIVRIPLNRKRGSDPDRETKSLEKRRRSLHAASGKGKRIPTRMKMMKRRKRNRKKRRMTRKRMMKMKQMRKRTTKRMRMQRKLKQAKPLQSKQGHQKRSLPP
mmetsp:Transcript_5604/g.12921  ORF Transcript_5604/g.12921 Transcript_5604/m.12921 type:complete len:223 (-) Transcript_5604:2431-3099(-)